MRGITSIGHVAIKVADIDRTLDFYVGKLGFEEMLRLDRDGRLWLLYLRITDDQYLEVFPEAEGDRAPPKEANGLNHVCLTVASIDDAVAQLDRLGIPLTSPRKLGADGNMQAWIEDPDGNRIELMEMAPDCLQAQAISRMRAARA
ncbi:MAG TPA: VOC family protein [Geminicoccaceae bacterium]|nr:VOC family protein [Geminicoccaceae bacterium]